jgi:nicotinamide mononucleotide transporter
LLKHYTDAARPYIDSLITWASVVTTWMVARRVVENWLYWVVIDGLAAILYFQQARKPTGVLFVFYVVISVYGYRAWLRNTELKTAH